MSSLSSYQHVHTQARPQTFEQSVALFTDGVFFGKSRLYSTSFFDVDRIEFIKGTQSTLFGENASLGGISVVTASRAPSCRSKAGPERGHVPDPGIARRRAQLERHAPGRAPRLGEHSESGHPTVS